MVSGASSGEQNRYRLSRAWNRRMNQMLHIATVMQIRLDTEGVASAAHRFHRCLAVGALAPVVGAAERPSAPHMRRLARARESTAGRLKNPARSTCPRTSTLRISHLPDPQNRRYSHPARSEPSRGLGSQPSASARRSRQGAAPHRTNDLDGDKRWCTRKGNETADLDIEGSRNDAPSGVAIGHMRGSRPMGRWAAQESTSSGDEDAERMA